MNVHKGSEIRLSSSSHNEYLQVITILFNPSSEVGWKEGSRPV
jgi:hypothetical protein